jgi:hypothetical protein
VTSGQSLIADKVLPITAGMLMADHEGAQMSPQFGIPLFKIESCNDGVCNAWRTYLISQSRPFGFFRAHHGAPRIRHCFLINVPESFPPPAKGFA